MSLMGTGDPNGYYGHLVENRSDSIADDVVDGDYVTGSFTAGGMSDSIADDVVDGDGEPVDLGGGGLGSDSIADDVVDGDPSAAHVDAPAGSQIPSRTMSLMGTPSSTSPRTPSN